MEAIADMTEEEAIALGRLMRYVSFALEEVTHCLKTYVIQFAEHPDHPHVHFHIVPRMANQPEARRSTHVFSYLGVAPEDRVSEDAMNEVALKVRHVLESRWSPYRQ